MEIPNQATETGAATPAPVFYILKKDGVQVGPYTESALHAQVASGALSADVPVWKEGMAEWQAYHQVFAEGEESSQKPLDTGLSFLKKVGTSALDAAHKGADKVREHDWSATLQKTNEMLKEYGDKADHLAGQYLGSKKKKTLKIASLVGACVVILLAAIIVKGGGSSNNDWRDNVSPEAEREYQIAEKCNRTKDKIEWYRRAAEKGHALALYDLAYCYSRGEGVKENKEEAAKLWEKAANLGYAPAYDPLTIYYKSYKKDEKEASKWYRKIIDYNMKSAKDGDADAQNKIAGVYHSSTREVEDAKKAAEWYKKAAEQGHHGAQLSLAECYYNGEGVKKDKREAVSWYKKALDGSDVRYWSSSSTKAAYHLGVCYCEGVGVEKNEEEGLKWLYMVATLKNYDNPIASIYIGKARSYLREHGVEIRN